jgi:hypothetical protein
MSLNHKKEHIRQDSAEEAELKQTYGTTAAAGIETEENFERSRHITHVCKSEWREEKKNKLKVSGSEENSEKKLTDETAAASQTVGLEILNQLQKIDLTSESKYEDKEKALDDTELQSPPVCASAVHDTEGRKKKLTTQI